MRVVYGLLCVVRCWLLLPFACCRSVCVVCCWLFVAKCLLCVVLCFCCLLAFVCLFVDVVCWLMIVCRVFDRRLLFGVWWLVFVGPHVLFVVVVCGLVFIVCSCVLLCVL